MLFTDKIDKRDILVRFFEENAKGDVVWEGWGIFKEMNVHKQYGISFKTPKYKNKDIDVPVNVFFHLQRRSDGVSSNLVPFQYVPDVTNISSAVNAKKRKVDNSKALYEYLQMHEADSRQKAKMTTNIDPNEGLENFGAAAALNIESDSNLGAAALNIGASNIGVAASNIGAASNFYVPTRHEQHYQQSNLEPIQQQDYQWPPHHPQYEQSQYTHQQSNHDRHHQQPFSEQYHHSQYHVQQYQNIPAELAPAQTDHQQGNCLASSPANYYSDNRNFYRPPENIQQHHTNAMPLSNHNSIADVCTMQPPFCSNNLSFNQQPAAEAGNCFNSNFDRNV